MKILNSNRLTLLLAVCVITVFSAMLLYYKLDQQPPTLYNWESYTVWKILDGQFQTQPTIDHFKITDGLMTDSGISPFMYFPIKFLTKTFGLSLLAMSSPRFTAQLIE